MTRQLPEIIQEVGFDFSWDEAKAWELDIPTDQMNIDELIWHLDVPFIWSKPNGFYDVTPNEVMDYPQKHPEEYARTMLADTRYPIDIMFWRERWVILDGLHRLMKQVIEGQEMVDVRKIPETAIPLIQKAQSETA